jgi:hypothetical protein
MDQRDAFDKINGMLEDTDYPITIRNIGDVEDFLLDDSSRRFINQYAAIGRIYDDLRDRPDIDRYPEPSDEKKNEEHRSAFNADKEINQNDRL